MPAIMLPGALREMISWRAALSREHSTQISSLGGHISRVQEDAYPLLLCLSLGLLSFHAPVIAGLEAADADAHCAKASARCITILLPV